MNRTATVPGFRARRPAACLALAAVLLASSDARAQAVAHAAAAPGRAGMILTRDRRIEGPVSLGRGAVILGGTAYRAERLILAVTDWDTQTIPAPHVLHLATGEAWRGAVVRLRGGALVFRSPVFGTRELSTNAVLRMDFVPNADPREIAVGTLFRRAGEAVPGPILWINERAIAIESPLGSLRIPEETALAYALRAAPPAAPAASATDVETIDGTILRGAARIEPDKILLQHGLLGAIEIPAAAVRAIRNWGPGYALLADLAPAALSVAPIHDRPLRDAAWAFDVCRIGQAGPFRSLRTVRLQAGAEVRYARPAAFRGPAVLRALVAPDPASREPVRLSVRVGNRIAGARELAPGQPAAELSAPLPAGEEVTLGVAFGDRALFPASVLIGDAVLLDPQAAPPEGGS